MIDISLIVPSIKKRSTSAPFSPVPRKCSRTRGNATRSSFRPAKYVMTTKMATGAMLASPP